jgi:two-component sensor histidine kinase
MSSIIQPDVIPLLRSDEKRGILTDSLLWNLLESIPTNISIWNDGKIMYANPAFYNALGVKEGNIDELNHLVENEGYFTIHPDDFDYSPEKTEQLSGDIRKGIVFHRELRMKSRLESEYRWYNTYVVKGADEGSKVIIEIDEDINDIKAAHLKLREVLEAKEKLLEEKEWLLKEKEILLKEIHHRVKNNFQVISSLLNLQARKTENPDIKLVLDESKNRVQSMAMIHEKLYRSDEVENINIAEHLKDVVAGLIELYGGKARLIKFDLEVENILLPLDKAIPCSLIVNEIVSNSLKYAFSNYDNARILIELHREKNAFKLTIRDNGIGLPEGFDYRQTGSLGLLIVNTLIMQIGGTVTCKNEHGAYFSFAFS